jgi:hypothetical protein
MIRRVVLVVTAFLLAAAGATMIFVLNDTSTPSAAEQVSEEKVSDNQSVDLSGFWKPTDDTKMEATITQSTIEIQWKEEGLSGLYWQGTFMPPANVVNGCKIVSEGDVNVMSDSALASSDTTKEFTYDKNKLSFKLTMIGITKTITLVKV